MGRRAPWHVLLVLRVCTAPCLHPTAGNWLAHCAVAEDCTTEPQFCECCELHRERTAYDEACAAICAGRPNGTVPGASPSTSSGEGFEFTEFGVLGMAQDSRDSGPHFDEPRLSLVGDASVVMGECYNYHIKTVEQRDGELQSCLMPPMPVPLFADDPTPTVHNLSVCGATKAPFHLEEATGIAHVLCFEECARRNMSQRVVPPRRANRDKLYIASCTRKCFTRCAMPLAADCSASCGELDFHCLSDCHANATVCSIPVGPRDLRYFRSDPNEDVCHDFRDEYVSCVVNCSDDCHAALKFSKRTLKDDVADWYRQECTSQTTRGANEATDCVTTCLDNCSQTCSEQGPLLKSRMIAAAGPAGEDNNDEETLVYRSWYGAPLRGCSNNCSRACSSACLDDEEALDRYRRQCEQKGPRNCTALCFSKVCPLAASFCTIFDLQNRPRALELNCSVSNVSFRDALMNRNLSNELEDINSPLSRLVKVNSSSDICYNDCFQDRSALSWEGYPYYTCKTTCYKKRCVKKCLSNCTAEAQTGGLPPCSIGQEPGQCMGPDCPENGVSCSWDKAVDEELQRSLINITAILANSSEAARAEVWVPTWGQSECEAIIDDVVGSWLDCLSSCRSTCNQRCEGDVNYTRSIRNVNDTSGLCALDCQRNCSAGCLASFRATDFCTVPGFPENPCTPPKSCSDDCSKSCLDPTYLRENHGEMCDGNASLVGPNETAVSLPYEYNRTYNARCSLNLTASECPLEKTYYNVSRHAGSLLFRTECVADCYGNCSVRCEDQYCTTALEEPATNINVCLPKCIQRHALLHFAPSDPVLNDASESNVTYCLRSCTADCVQAVTPACEMRCEPLLNPAVWDLCVSTCVTNTSFHCKRECVYTCTGNHTVAFGVPAPYDATGDYLVFSEVWEAQVSPLPDERPNERPWNNYSAECYANCSIACTQPCFESAELMCRANITADPQYQQLSPRATAFQTNNCTLREAASCFSDCRDFCHESCGNLSDPVVIARRERAAERAVYNTYVETCEEKCKLQIYGRNITTEERCLAFYPGYREECMYNCTQQSVAGCVTANSTFDVYKRCNSTCDELKFFVEVVANATAADGSEDGTTDGAPTASKAAAGTDDSPEEGAAATGAVVAMDGTPTGAAASGGGKKRTGYIDTTEFDICIASCSQNYTDPKRWKPGTYYDCDGGENRREGLAVLEEMELASMLDGGVSLTEQKQIDEQRASIPYGQMCDEVNNECVFNASLLCDVQCAAEVEYFQQLCIVKEQRNASFDYNISQCRHPDGWMVGSPKYLFYRRQNESDPLGAVPEKIRRAPHWSYDDVEDHTILNCTCHFRNGTYDPRFVAFMLESEMRPYQNHFVSVCSCLFNETLGEPEHCIQSNHTFAEQELDWLLNPPKRGDAVVLNAKEVLVEEFHDNFLDCAISVSVISDEEDSTSRDYQRETFVPRVQYCYEQCGYHLIEQLVEPLSGNLSYAHFTNITGPVRLPGHPHAGPGPGLRGLVNSTEFADRNMFWYAEPECLLTCFSRIADGLKDSYIGPRNNMTENSWKINSCTGPCQAACYMHRKGNGHLKGNTDNETAEAFACLDDATAEEGEPYCIATCQCFEDCSHSCVEQILKLETSAEHYEFFPDCMANCTRRCTMEHHEVCENVTLAVLAASIPPWVNETEQCSAHIYTTCDFHCLPHKPTNLTGNTTLFPARELPRELRFLDIRPATHDTFQGYHCNIEKCPELPEPCPYPNVTLVESGYMEDIVDPASGNVTTAPVMWNVSFPSYLGCKHNRSSTCLDTCHDFGYRVCFPGEDPFDTCVQACVANKTYEPPLPEFDHDVAACTKALRLTPSVEERKGAAWHKHKQRVQAGFNTTFTFKLGYPSERCAGAGTGVGDGPGAGAYPNHEERPGTLDMLCEFRGGDGFAFVIQDSGATMLEPECVFGCVDECTGNATQICTDECLSTCPARAGIAQATCTEDCAAGQHGEAVCPGFVSDCARRCVAAGGASVQQFALGTAMEPGGCMRECVWTGSYDEGGYCHLVCPLVDEDLDEECILACTERRLKEARGCLDTCAQVCASRTEAALETCNVECQGPNALLPSGELVETCRQFAEVHLPHVGSVCMTSCRHDDDACLSKCARSPPDHISSCVDACPQNSTQCVVSCLGRREQMATVCMLPCVKGRCSHESVAIGEGANGVGFATLPNVIAVKFDTWFNAEAGDPLYNHVAVHASGPVFGTSTDVNDALAVASAVPDLGDGKYHTVRIEYEPELSGPLGEAYSDAPAVGRYIVPIGKPAAVTAKHQPPQEAEEAPKGSIAEWEALQGKGREGREEKREEKQEDALEAASPTSANVTVPPQKLEAHGPRKPGDAHGLGELRVIIDGKQVLMLPINVGDLLKLDEGRAWVGFTGATGATYQEHTIAHWLWGDQPCSVKLDRRGLDIYSCGE